jgi:hypothetical protein
MPGSSTSESKIGQSPVEGLKKIYSTPAALSCWVNIAPPVPRISRMPGDAVAASGVERDWAMDFAAATEKPTAVRPAVNARREIPWSRYCLTNFFPSKIDHCSGAQRWPLRLVD